jgi:antitoxin component YwqK of YwqJK toxin-antitoxin module
MNNPLSNSKLWFLILATSCLPFFGFTQTTKWNQKDGNGKRQGYWVYKGKDRPKSGYPAAAKIEEGNYKDNRKVGVWLKYYTDGVTLKQKITYVNNRPEGPYTKYHSNGLVKEIGNISKNQFKDSLKRYHDNGVLSYAAYYQSGVEKGTVKFYYSNGQLEFQYSALGGKPSGKATRYYENGDVKEILEYGTDGNIKASEKKEMVSPPVKTEPKMEAVKTAPKAAEPNTRGVKFQPNGYNKVYNANDDIWQDGIFKNSQLWDGKVYEYDNDGILLKVKVYKGGKYHSDGQL